MIGHMGPRRFEPSSDTFPRDTTQVLTALGQQVEEWHRSFVQEGSFVEFVVNVSPVTGPETRPSSNHNAFEQILRGVLSFNDSGGKEVDLYRVAVLAVTRHARVGTVSTHSLLVTPLPSRMYRGSFSIAGYQTYAFVRVATSGYSGTGPALYRALNILLDSFGPAIIRAEIEVEFDPLRRLFLNYGPTFVIRWPDMLFPPAREWNGEGEDRMADRYSESERE